MTKTALLGFLLTGGVLSAAATPTASVAVEDFSTCAPVVTASGVTGAASVTVEWSDAEDGAYATLATLPAPAGDTCAYTNDWALVGIKRWYRAKVGETASAAVAFTRFRNVARDSRNARSSLYPGVLVVSGGVLPFDGKTDNYYDSGSYATICLNLGKAHYLAGTRYVPRYNNPGRSSKRNWYAAKNADDHAAGTYVAVGYVGQQQAYTWLWSSSTDTANTYQYTRFTADFGNLCEMQIYGWSADDQASPAGTVSFDVENYSNCCPVITWTYPKGATNVQLQVSRAADRGFTTLASLDNPVVPSAVFTNTSAKVGVKRYYRVVAVADGVTTASAAVGHTRFRRIDRNPGQENVRFSKYTYSDNRFFDGILDAAFDGSAAPGIIFNERLWVAGVRTYPRPNFASRVEGKTFYGYLTQSDSAAGTSRVLNNLVLGITGSGSGRFRAMSRIRTIASPCRRTAAISPSCRSSAGTRRTSWRRRRA